MMEQMLTLSVLMLAVLLIRLLLRGRRAARLLVLALVLLALTAGCVFSGTQETEAVDTPSMEATAPEPAAEKEPSAPELVEETETAGPEPEVPEPEAWKRYPDVLPDYPDLHVEDAQGNDISAELIDLWYASSAVYNVDDYQMFSLGEKIDGYTYVELLDYDQVISAIFTEDGQRQLELTHLRSTVPLPLLLLEDGKVYRKTAWKTGYFYGAALKDMEVLAAEEDRLTIQVTYQRDRGIAAPDPDPQYDTLEWEVVRTDGLWKVESYPYPEDCSEGMLYSTKGTYTDSLGNQFEYSYEVPLFRLDSEDAQAVNQAIRDGMGAKVAEQLANMENGVSLVLNRVSYRLARYQTVGTVILRADYGWESTDYAVYHYDYEAGRFLTNEELLEKTEIDPEAYLTALRAAAEQEFLDSVPDADMETLGGQEFYDQQYAATMSGENLNLDTLLFCQGGALYAIVPIYGFAGATWYYHVIPLDLRSA